MIMITSYGNESLSVKNIQIEEKQLVFNNSMNISEDNIFKVK
jgi:hypothetical protein